MCRTFHDRNDVHCIEITGVCNCEEPSKERSKAGLPQHVKHLAKKIVKTNANITPLQLREELLVESPDCYDIAHMQVKSWLRHHKKLHEKGTMESTIGGIAQWVQDNAPVSTTQEHDPIVLGSILMLKRAQLVISVRAMIRAMRRLRGRLVLAMDSTHKISWNRWPLHVLGIADVFHSFYPIAWVFGNKEDQESCEYFLRAVIDYYYSLHRESPGNLPSVTTQQQFLQPFKKFFRAHAG